MPTNEHNPSIPSLFDLSGRTAVVVGAGSGLGQASALGLADAGAHVIAADLNVEGAEATVRLIADRRAAGGAGAGTGASAGTGAVAEAARVDITDSASVDALVAAHPEAQVLVITPGANVRKRLTNTTDEEFDKVIDINLKGTYRLMRGFGTEMAERGRGSIVTYSSFRALTIEAGQGLYAAAKAGVVQLTKTMASELGPRGVRVNAILPGPFDTPLTQQIKADGRWWGAYADKTALGRWGTLHEIAGPVLFLASDASSYVTGHSQLVDGGWMAHDGRFTPDV
ncbi:SDR family NAD(P)-dependent oxidoreductase [Brevibacterium sp. GP-SGM9]|uniref:SDR family NAD(P)-dependent oxidoreductase n=1 Tax=unclassified Brevibacterium TaxID=2614124 RepID=UPI001E3436CA|nr:MULTISPECIES: SDR family NAD(P)-dependent oxidoreductase [unclassified Brevibacterium]MCD1285374.1 3-oxoacyl-ACP reductase [Brevibacterium sp. CCUG 69071]MDK8434422.1 SDR family NAD(P)-dependent oxidoreductase [Brevibacterium sp. H-BE7]